MRINIEFESVPNVWEFNLIIMKPPGTQVGGNFHRSYPQEQPQLP